MNTNTNPTTVKLTDLNGALHPFRIIGTVGELTVVEDLVIDPRFAAEDGPFFIYTADMLRGYVKMPALRDWPYTLVCRNCGGDAYDCRATGC